MSLEKKFETETLPNGLKVVSGGTRTAVCLNRPWQSELALLVNPKTCPFETAHLLNGAVKRFRNGWLAVDNIHTVHSYHKLIMPKTCWSAARLGCLGGASEIEKAFHAAEKLAEGVTEELLFLVQIGLHGGQSRGHPHYQLQSAERSRLWSHTEKFLGRLNSKLVIARNALWQAVLGGKYAGQCFIMPRTRTPLYLCDRSSVRSLSGLVSRVVNLYNKKFRSGGLPPDFSIGFIFHNGQIKVGSYVPALYHQWGARDKLADVFGLSVAVSWPHETTFRYLAEVL